MNPAVAVPLIAAGLLSVPAAIKLIAFLRSRRLRGQRIGALEAALPPELHDAKTLLVYFSSPACGMCRVMEPIIDEVSRDTPVVKLDVARHPDAARALGVLGTPTTVVLRDGKVQEILLGVKSARRLRALIRGDHSPLA